MDQYSYETIMACIQHGAPAIANKLVASFNKVVELANQQVRDIQAKQQAAEEEARKAKQQIAAEKAKAAIDQEIKK